MAYDILNILKVMLFYIHINVCICVAFLAILFLIGVQNFAMIISLTYVLFKGSLVVPTPDQDETDFTKGLRVLLQMLVERKSKDDVRACFSIALKYGNLRVDFNVFLWNIC